MQLIACDSTNPDLSPGGAGEAAVAALIAERLRSAGLEVSLEEVAPGRPNVIGRLRGTGGGRTLMLWGHTDVVAADPEGFAPRLDGGRIYGRGAVDMKGGLACAIAAAEELARGPRPAGDVIVAGVIDEEWVSLGAAALVQRYAADGAILTEQSDLELIVEHGGFAWFELTSRGVESAGIEPDRGVDAIALLAPVLAGITEPRCRVGHASRPRLRTPVRSRIDDSRGYAVSAVPEFLLAGHRALHGRGRDRRGGASRGRRAGAAGTRGRSSVRRERGDGRRTGAGEARHRRSTRAASRRRDRAPRGAASEAARGHRLGGFRADGGGRNPLRDLRTHRGRSPHRRGVRGGGFAHRLHGHTRGDGTQLLWTDAGR